MLFCDCHSQVFVVYCRDSSGLYDKSMRRFCNSLFNWLVIESFNVGRKAHHTSNQGHWRDILWYQSCTELKLKSNSAAEQHQGIYQSNIVIVPPDKAAGLPYMISSIETSACSRMDFSVPNLSIFPACIGTETLQFFEECLRTKWLPF